jgi:glucosyl-3-phosphoglycerate synthase
MADFFQPGVVTTIHRLTTGGLERMESDLARFSTQKPVGLILPALYTEFEHPAMRGIVAELREARWLRRIVVPIARCSREQYLQACSFFEGFTVPVTALWMEHPEVEAVLRSFQEAEIHIGESGKGQTVWLCLGYLLARGDVEVIALHDADIRGYSRELLARLVYPIAHPNLGFEFSKGFYARVSNKLHGRVTRLFFTPLVRAIQDMTPEIPYLRFLDSFRYALAGEFAMTADLARVMRIPSDWGLEVGTLAEVYRNVALSRVCQVDIAENYEHKHQILSADDPAKGLRRMTTDIAKSVFRTIAQEGYVLTADHFRTLLIYYTRFAQDTIRRFYADAVLNGLHFDLHEENTEVALFARSLQDAAENYVKDPLGLPQIPNWNRVAAAIPDVFERLRAAAEAA